MSNVKNVASDIVTTLEIEMRPLDFQTYHFILPYLKRLSILLMVLIISSDSWFFPQGYQMTSLQVTFRKYA